MNIFSAVGQEDEIKNWIVALDFGMQSNDKRLFSFPGKNHLLESQHQLFGTYQLSLSFAYKILQNKKNALFGGLGISTELSTFRRPFDSHYGNVIGPDILTYTDRYYQYLLQAPISFNHFVSPRFGLTMQVLTQCRFRVDAQYSKTENYTYVHSWDEFDFYSVELNPGIVYSINKVDFNLRFRIFQVKKIDRIIFNYLVADPRTDQKLETHNPFKFLLGVNCHF